MYKIGIDVGGTFTDFVVAEEGGQPRFFKTQSTPNPESTDGRREDAGGGVRELQARWSGLEFG